MFSQHSTPESRDRARARPRATPLAAAGNQMPRHESAGREIRIGEDEGQTALLVDGVVQSVLVSDGPLGPGYWPHMLPEVRPTRALVLGLGGGTICRLILRQFGQVEIVGVECDARVLRLARSAFGVEQ